MPDLVIRGGTLFDGMGGEPYVADIAITNGKIIAVGSVVEYGREEIDARGKMVTPGFIDIHTHYDGQLIWDDGSHRQLRRRLRTLSSGRPHPPDQAS
jgi:N-acyl-D-amino-acid deacylase